MKTLNRDKIQRMFGQQAGGAGGSSVNGDGDGVSKLWVEQNYLSKEFFLRLFNIHGEDENDDPVDVQPNDLETTITDIEAMFGFWTEEYLSALGQNDDQGGGGITLNAALASINNSPLGNPTGTNTVLMFNGTTWVYATMGSTDMNTVWTALAAATNQQINISHLTTALSGYATTSQLSDYATVTDLEQLASYFNTLSGYFTNGAANEAVKLETARTIWGQQFDGTANITGDITQATCLEFSGIAGTATNGGFIDFHYAGGGADYTSRIIEDVSGVLKINNTIWAQLSGNVSIGTSTISQTYKLDVAGYTKTTRLYLADGVYLEYDSTNSGVHLVGAGFYSDSYVSALGVNSGGGGSGGSDYIPLTGSSSITGTLAPSVATADLGSSTNKWRNIYGTSLSISNTLTTYALTVNSSATVAGSITATNGNLVASTGYVSSAGGYKVTGKDDTSVLLAGGGTKPLSEIIVGSISFSDIQGTMSGTQLSAAINNLDVANVAPIGTSYYVSQQALGETNTYYRRPVSALAEYVRSTITATTITTALGYTPVRTVGTEQIIESTISSVAEGAINIYRSSGNHVSLIGFSNKDDNNNRRLLGYIGFDSGNAGNLIYRTTTGTNYGIWHEGNFNPSNYLPLTGGTLSNPNWASQLTVDRTDGAAHAAVIAFKNVNGILGCLGMTGTAYGYLYLWNGDATNSCVIVDNRSLDVSVSGQTLSITYFGTTYSLTNTDTNTFSGLSGSISNSQMNDGIRNLNTASAVPIGACYYISEGIAEGGTTGNGLYYRRPTSALAEYVRSTITSSTITGALGYTPVNKAGDTMSSSSRNVLTLNTTDSDGAWMGFNTNGTFKGFVGIYQNALFLGYGNGNSQLDISSGGIAIHSKLTIDSNSIGGAEHLVFNRASYNYITMPVNGILAIGGSYAAGADQILYIRDSSVGIKTGFSTLTHALEVNGTICLTHSSSKRLYFGADNNHYIELDSNGYFHFSHGVYSDGFVSALGLNSGGGGAVDYIPLSGSTSITGNLTPSNNNSVSLGSSSKLWAGVYCTNLRAYGASSIAGNLSLAGSITPTTDKQYSLGTESLRFAGLFVHGRIYLSGMNIQYLSSGSGVLGGYHFQAGSSDIILETSGYVWQRTTSQYYSDIRRKNIVSYIDTPVDKIANAPIFTFTWKDFTGNMQQGSSAQYWRDILPNGVAEASNGTLGMDYATTALISAVITARKVVDHEARIRLLEVENAALRNEINQLKKVA